MGNDRKQMKASYGKNIFCPLIIISLLIVGLLYAANWYFVKCMPDRGTFGDMFGVVNALFSGLAFAGIIVTLFLQKDELALQREELKQTREELRGQKEQLALQNQAMKKQNFENTFFQMLRLHNEIINSIDVTERRSPSVTINHSGRDCFACFHEELKKLDTSEHEAYFESKLSELGHYYRNLYHIIKFVHNSDVEDKKFYTNLVRAQLSTYELLLLFHNCLGKYGYEKFKPLVEEYALLKNISDNQELDPHKRNKYDRTAFGEIKS